MEKFITILPYLGFQDELSLGRGIKIWNFHKYKNKYITDAYDRQRAETLVDMFEKSEWVNVISVKDRAFARCNNRTIQETELLLFISSLGLGNASAEIDKNDDSRSSSEHFVYNQWSLDRALEPKLYFCGSFLEKLTNPTFFLVQKGTILKPPIVTDRTNQNTKFDTKLLLALDKLRKHNRRLSNKIFRSLEMLFITASNNPIIPQLDHIILATAAFENLLGKDRENVKNRIDKVFKGSRLYVSKYEDIHGKKIIEKRSPRRTSHAIWYEHLHSARNRILHGDELPTKYYRYHNQRHRYIAQLIYLQCLKQVIKDELGINLGGNVIRIKEGNKRWFRYVI